MSKNKRTNRNKGKSDIEDKIISKEVSEALEERNKQEYEEDLTLTKEELDEVEERKLWLEDITDDELQAKDEETNTNNQEELQENSEEESELSEEDYDEYSDVEDDVDYNNDLDDDYDYSDEEDSNYDDDEYYEEYDESYSDEDDETSDEYYDDNDEEYVMTEDDKKAVAFAKIGLVIAIFVALFLVAFGVCLIRYNSNKKKQTIEIQSNYQTITTDWVKNFAEGNFEACDKNVMEQYKILLNDDDKSYDYYIYALKQLGISIRYIEVEKDTEKENTYIIKLTYNPFKKIDKITLNEAKVKEYKELETKYVQGSSADSDVKELLDDITTKAYYENCFNIDENISNTEILVLTEENRDGVTYVQGTSKFIDLFLEDSNLKNNIDIYQTQITETISNMINDK